MGVENACDIARRFLGAGIEEILTDVVDAEALPLYRERLPNLVVVQLRVEFTEARRRAATRPIYLTMDEFATLHHGQATSHLAVNHVVDVSKLSLDDQSAAIVQPWSRRPKQDSSG